MGLKVQRDLVTVAVSNVEVEQGGIYCRGIDRQSCGSGRYRPDALVPEFRHPIDQQCRDEGIVLDYQYTHRPRASLSIGSVNLPAHVAFG